MDPSPTIVLSGIIILTVIALSAFGSLAVIACVVKSGKTNPIVENDVESGKYGSVIGSNRIEANKNRTQKAGAASCSA